MLFGESDGVWVYLVGARKLKIPTRRPALLDAGHFAQIYSFSLFFGALGCLLSA